MEIKFTNLLFYFKKSILQTIMRSFIFLFCIVSFGFTPNSSNAQRAKITINSNSELAINEVFELIREQTDYTFVYTSDLFKNTPNVPLEKGTIKTDVLLDKCLSNTVFTYDFVDESTILLKRKPEFKGTELVMIPQQTITGTVRDVNGNGLPGVNVLVGKKGSNVVRGVATDFDGKYSVNASKGEIVKFSYLGYITQEVEIGDQKNIDIILKEDTENLEEVTILSTGYQKISKERATGSYDVVETKQLEKPASSISERLVGVAAGVESTINADGSIDFEIRGLSSLSANQDPLIVLDGFPIEGGFETINPNDVESITVLKDAAASSIWGARAANGVIVIVTNKGAKGKTKVAISSFIRTSSKLDLDYALNRASSSEIIEYEQKAFDSNFFGSVFGGAPGISPNELSPFSQAIVAMNEARLGRISESERDTRLATLSGLNNEKQIKDLLLESPLTQQHNITISGGTEKMTNSLSLMFEDSKSFFIGDKTEKYLINYNNSTKLANKINFEFGAMFQHTDATTNSGQADPIYGGGDMLSEIRSLAPWDMLANSDGSLTDMSYLKYYKPNLDQFVPYDLFPYSDWSYNPVTEVKNRDLRTKQINARFKAGLTFDIIEGMQLSSRIQYELYNSSADNYYGEETFAVRQFINETSGPEWQFGGTPTQLVPDGGILEQGESEIRSYNFRNQLTFNRTFAEKHTIDFVGGTEIRNTVVKTTTNPAAFGYNPESLTSSQLLTDLSSHSLWNFYPAQYASYFYDFNLIPEHQFSENTDRFFAMYTNLAYTYNKKYTISGNYRTDAANIIADDPKLRYDPFWHAGLGWHIGKEDYMSDINWLDKLYLRSTYGSGGNIIPTASFTPLINLSSSLNQVTKQLTASITDVGNPTLRWEKTKSFNIGADFSTMGGKLKGSIDYYNKKGEDLIINQALSGVYGTTSQLLNNGKMVNKGIEINLSTYLPIKGNDIVWSGNLTFSNNKNEITELKKGVYAQYELVSGPTTSYREGYDANTLWSYDYGGLYDTGVGNVPSIIGDGGDLVPITGWASGDARNYMVDQGTTNAPTILGFRNSFKIYDFDFSFIVTGKFGHVFRRQGFNYSAVTGGNTNVNEQYSEVANGDPNLIIPIPDNEPSYYFYDRYYPYMDYLTEDAGHIRIQEINLTYSLPKNVITKLGVDRVSFFAQANNVGVILFNDFNEDPEYPKGYLRPQAMYTFGMNLNF